MAKYDVYRADFKHGYLVDIQCDLLEDLNTRVVVPLMLVDQAPKAAARLNPVFEFNGSEYVLVTQFLSSVPVSILQDRVENIAEFHEDVVAAIDMLTKGF